MGKLHSKHKLKKSYLKELHNEVPSMDIESITDAYHDFKRQSRGKHGLSKSGFVKVYTEAIGPNAATFAGHIFDAFDIDRDGKVDFKEFLIGLSMTEPRSTTDRASQIAKLKWTFSVYDKNKSGTIDQNEMRLIVKAVFELGMVPDTNKTAEEYADDLFDEVDANKDGEISFDEFMLAAEHNCALIDMLIPMSEPET